MKIKQNGEWINISGAGEGGSIDIDLDNANPSDPNPINADTLGGYSADTFIKNTDVIDADTLGGYAAENYARKEDLENIDIDADLLSENVKNKIMYGKSRNLFINMGVTQTVNGVTFTINDDKSITINGTATDSAGISLFGSIEGQAKKTINIPKGSVLTGIPDIEGLWLCLVDYFIAKDYIYNKKYEYNDISFPIINDILKEQDIGINYVYL